MTARIQIALVRTNYHYFPSPPIVVKRMGKTQHPDAQTLYRTVRLLNKSRKIAEYLDAVSHFTASQQKMVVSNNHLCLPRMTKLQMVYSLTSYTDFTKVFFAFKMSHCFTEYRQTYFHLHPFEKYDLPSTGFHSTHKRSNRIMCIISNIKLHPNQTTNVTKMQSNSFTPVREVWLSPCWFSKNAESLNKVLWRFPAPNIFQIWQKM